MNRSELLNTLAPLTIEEQVKWMLSLGGQLTVAARHFYETGTTAADGPSLRGFNEIQHRVYARIRDLSNGHEWTLESFIDMIHDYSLAYGIETEVRQALVWSCRATIKPN